MKQRSVFLFGALALAASLLSACVSIREPDVVQAHYETLPSPVRQARLAKINTWNIRGAFSLQYQHRSDLANYYWQQSADGRYRLKIASSLNLYTLTLSKEHHRVVLVRSGQRAPITGKSPEDLLQKSMGWHIPVRPLTYWIRGLVAPGGEDHIQFDRYGHLIRVKQLGWQVSLSHYLTPGFTPGGTPELAPGKNDFPHRLDLVGYGMKIRIVVKSGIYG